MSGSPLTAHDQMMLAMKGSKARDSAEWYQKPWKIADRAHLTTIKA